MQYQVIVHAPLFITVDAPSPDAAIGQVRRQLLANKQMKEASPVEFSVAEEVSFEEITQEKQVAGDKK